MYISKGDDWEKAALSLQRKKGKAHSTITFQGKHLGGLPEKRKMLSINISYKVHLALAACPSDFFQAFE